MMDGGLVGARVQANAAAMLGVVWQNEMLMRLVFVLGNGPLLLAIAIWRNNFVFHDLEQVTSVMIHVRILFLFC